MKRVRMGSMTKATKRPHKPLAGVRTRAWVMHAFLACWLLVGGLVGCEAIPTIPDSDSGTHTDGLTTQPPSQGPNVGGDPADSGSGTDPRTAKKTNSGDDKRAPLRPVEMETCEQDRATRCAGAGQREQCSEGVWGASDPCPEGHVCMASEDGLQTDCQSVAEICKGSAGETVCDDGGTLFTCSDAGVAEGMEACASARHCQLGRERGACAMCVPSTSDGFRCQGVELEACRADGSGYEAHQSCDTEALCNTVAGACTAAACTPGQELCDGDTLMRCAEDQTSLEMVATCEPGLCDAEAGGCDACVPDAATCDGNTSVVCNGDGTELVRTPCPKQAPFCVGNGRCVQCGKAEDCGPAASCMIANCDLAAGECRPQNAAARTRCTGGLCDGQGNCRQCLDAEEDCPPVGACQVRFCSPDNGRCEPAPARSNTPCGNGGYCDGEGQCDSCRPGERMCNGDSVMTCKSDGQGYTSSSCPNGQMCTGEGDCVECITDLDCNHLTEGCKVGECSRNRCTTGDATNGKRCTTGGGQPGTCSSGTCNCTRQCSGKQCGSDGCGGECGECAPTETCRTNGRCECVKQCAGRDCGNDGCGGVCGTCRDGDVCRGGQCECQPQCSGKECGRDGCGDDCGSCDDPRAKCDGQCYVPRYATCQQSGLMGPNAECGDRFPGTCFAIGGRPAFCAPSATSNTQEPCPGGLTPFGGAAGVPCLKGCTVAFPDCPAEIPRCIEYIDGTGMGFCSK